MDNTMSPEVEKAIERLDSGQTGIKEVLFTNINKSNEILAEICTNIAVMNATLKSVDEQVKRTNGRVTDLEKFSLQLERQHLQCPITMVSEKVIKLEKNGEKVDEVLLDAKFKQRFPEQARKQSIGNALLIIGVFLTMIASAVAIFKTFM